MDRPLVTSLAKIQAQLKAPKTQYNSFGKYNYRKAEDILEAVKPLLAAEGSSAFPLLEHLGGVQPDELKDFLVA